MDYLDRFREWVATALFGPRCEYGCGSHVFPRDREVHAQVHCPVTVPHEKR